jgi:hypothetical protein
MYFLNNTMNFSTLLAPRPHIENEYFFIFTTLTYGFVILLSIISTTSVNMGIGMLFLVNNVSINKTQFFWIIINMIINFYLNYNMMCADNEKMYIRTLVLLFFYFLSTISLCNFYIRLRLIEYIILLILFQPHFVIIFMWMKKFTIYYNTIKRVNFNYKSHNCENNCIVCPCSICYEKIDKIVCLDCKHSFHYKCLTNWIVLNNYNTFCPICRSNIVLK